MSSLLYEFLSIEMGTVESPEKMSTWAELMSRSTTLGCSKYGNIIIYVSLGRY